MDIAFVIVTFMVTCHVLLRSIFDSRSDLSPLGRHLSRHFLMRRERMKQILSFLSLPHSFAESFSTTPLQSYSSALFAQNTGGGYTPRIPPHVFKGLRALPVCLCRPVSVPQCLPGRQAGPCGCFSGRNFFTSGTSNGNHSRV